MIAKHNITQIARLALLIKALNVATIYLKDKNYSYLENINNELEDFCQSTSNENRKADTIIDLETILKAIDLLEYFNQAKLKLSGYETENKTVSAFMDLIIKTEII